MIKTYLKAINEALDEAMSQNNNVVIMGEDVGIYGGSMGVTSGLLAKYGEKRVIDMPISETAFTGAAVGAAIVGLRPVVEIFFSDFITFALDPLINHAAKLHFMSAGQINVPMVLRTDIGAGTGAAAQHSQSIESLVLNTPGLKVLAPSNARNAKGLMLSAIDDDGPVVFLEHKLLYKKECDVPDCFYKTAIGKADISKEGSDITLIAYSYMSELALTAAKELAMAGINAEVIDLLSLSPLDSETIINSVKKTGRAVVIQEAPKFGGFAGEIVSLINEKTFDYLKAPVARVCGSEMPIAYNIDIEGKSIPSVESILEKVKEIMK